MINTEIQVITKIILVRLLLTATVPTPGIFFKSWSSAPSPGLPSAGIPACHQQHLSHRFNQHRICTSSEKAPDISIKCCLSTLFAGEVFPPFKKSICGDLAPSIFSIFNWTFGVWVHWQGCTGSIEAFAIIFPLSAVNQTFHNHHLHSASSLGGNIWPCRSAVATLVWPDYYILPSFFSHEIYHFFKFTKPIFIEFGKN